MRRNWVTAVAFAVLCTPLMALAADHRDGPMSKSDPSTDLNDVYAWMSGDASKVYLVMTLFPDAKAGTSKFSNVAKYVFHVNSRPNTLNDIIGGAKERMNIICTFAGDPQKASCWVVNTKDNATAVDYITGDASATAGITSTSGKIKLFTGIRDDAFFFNLTGFKNAAKFVHDNAAALQAGGKFDANGCPMLTSDQVTAAVTTLKSPANNDDFRGFNTLAIVLAVDKSLISPGGSLLGVWGSTNK